MGNRLGGLHEVLLAQCLPEDVDEVLAVADRPGTGLVVTTGQVEDLQRAAALAQGCPLLVDAQRYKGRWRAEAAAPFSRPWLEAQHAAGLPVLTDSGYADRGDEDGLFSVLHRAAELTADGDLGEVIATLALHPWWLDAHGGLDRLLGRVRAVDVPVAVVLEHVKDPFSELATLDGMLALLSVGVPVIQLRSDVSGLGMLCHGAWAAAVGTRSGLRHLYPRGGRGGRPASPVVSTMVRECLTYVSVDKIAAAVQRNPDDSLWQSCCCRCCQGRPPDWMSRVLEEERQQKAAFGHSLEVLFDLRDDLILRPDRDARQVSWREHCNNALSRFTQLNREDGQRWDRPPALRRWYELPVPTSAARS